MSGRKGKGKHQRTESQAVTELENVFKSVDLEGDGQLDKASFSTAMFSLDLMLDDEKLEEVFEQIDKKDKGYIDYEEFLDYLKSGKMTRESGAVSKILNAAKSMPGSYAKANKAIAQSSLSSLSQPSTAATLSPFAGAPAAQAKPVEKKKLDPKKKQIIQRAVIVIKKAAMKNISRDEVMEFLKDKGMNQADIEYAYEKAQEQAMSPEERVRYFKARVEQKDKEIEENKAFSRHLNAQVSTAKKQISSLQAALYKAVGKLMKSHKDTYADVKIPDRVVNELLQQISGVKKSMKGIAKGKALLEVDLQKLNDILSCCKEQMYFHAYLFFMTLEPVVQGSLPSTGAFLREFE